MYDTLLSAGGFANYRGILPIYKTLIPRYGSMQNRGNRERIVHTFLRSLGFRRTGLDAARLSEQILSECHTGGDFIRVVMDAVAQSQQMPRWSAYDADSVLHVEEIKRDIPNALFVHIVRDGRDIALSLKKMGGFAPLPWDTGQTASLVATALYWKWMVQRGRSGGSRFPADYIEVRYEDLVAKPHETLATLGRFLDHDLDYDRIQRTSLGRLSETNSSFREEGAQATSHPQGRWKQRLTHADIAALEATVGESLQENGYELSLPAAERRRNLRLSAMRKIYPAYLETKQWLKVSTPLGRFARLSALELEDEPIRVAASARS
jgi:hypothetical protein